MTEKNKQLQNPSTKQHQWPQHGHFHCTPNPGTSKKGIEGSAKSIFSTHCQEQNKHTFEHLFAAYFSGLFIKSDAPLKCTVKITTVNSTTAEYCFNKILLPTDVKIHSIVIQNWIQLEDKLTNTLFIQQVSTTL